MPDDEWLVSGSTSIEEVRGYYDDQAPTYDSTLAGWGYDAPWRVAELLTGSLTGGGSSPTVLDAGCGTGLAGQALREKVEGVARSHTHADRVYVVIDADDPARASELCEVQLAGAWA